MSWGDPWVQAFQGVSRAAENYGAIKYNEQKEALAKKALEQAERLAKENEVIWRGFSPTGEYSEMTRGQAMGGAGLPDFEVKRLKTEKTQAQADVDAKRREQEAKISGYETRAASDQARAQASLSRAALDDAKRSRPQDFRSQGGRGSGLAKPTPTPEDAIIESIQAAAQSMIQEKEADPEVIKSRLYGMYPPTLVDKAFGKRSEPPIGSLFNMNPMVDDLLRSDTYK